MRSLSQQLQTRRLESRLEDQTIYNQRSQTLKVYNLQMYTRLYPQQYHNSQTVHCRHYKHLLILRCWWWLQANDLLQLYPFENGTHWYHNDRISLRSVDHVIFVPSPQRLQHQVSYTTCMCKKIGIAKLFKIYGIEVQENGYGDSYMFMEPLNKGRIAKHPIRVVKDLKIWMKFFHIDVQEKQIFVALRCIYKM